MKRIIHISLIFGLTTVAFIACTSKTATDNNKIENKESASKQDSTQDMQEEYSEINSFDPCKIIEAYTVVEQMPQFPGGDSALLEYIHKNLRYPIKALENHIQGTVILRFVVTRTGEVEKFEMIRSLYLACDKEALRVAASLPKFIPGKQNGVNVNVYYTLPIKFKLE